VDVAQRAALARALNRRGVAPITTGEMAPDRLLRVDAPRATGAMLVEHCDVPAGMTLAEWRRASRAEASGSRAEAPGVRARLRRGLRRG
jgi:hypothetical protein